ncbi:MAG TPA: PRC and DUF2382 domain-containing protein [Sphingomicrobium sp.]|nr:PRC and DUF2382 domain-containing protein [Sphingomicrobium sp.]
MERNDDRNFPKLESLDKYELEHSDQDLRGQTLFTHDGKEVGKVDDMLVDTDGERVAALCLEDNRVIDIDHVDIRDGKPVLLVPQERIPQPAADFDRSNATTQHIPIIEERLEVGKRPVETGKVRIRTRTESEPVSKTVELRDERIDVDRRAVNERVGDKEANVMFKDKDIEMTAHGEKAVVDKEARVKEELVVSKEGGSHQETIKGNVRHTEVDVDRDSKPSDRS